ncbi:MAG: hypothetical protein ACREF9_12870, partial [Opitutaceae bacterium]
LGPRELSGLLTKRGQHGSATPKKNQKSRRWPPSTPILDSEVRHAGSRAVERAMESFAGNAICGNHAIRRRDIVTCLVSH